VPAHNILAVDLGAESGRAILGTIEDGRLRIRETARFPNKMVRVSGRLHWDVSNLYEEITNSLKACPDEGLESIGLDTWGVDFALLDGAGEFLGLPYTYRDSRTEGSWKIFTPTKETCSQDDRTQENGDCHRKRSFRFQVARFRSRKADFHLKPETCNLKLETDRFRD
jgi:hypothetical protein